MKELALSGWLLLVVLFNAGCGQEAPAPTPQPSATGAEPPAQQPARGETRERTVYVPAYSHLGATKTRALFAITLSVRNIDPTSTITLSHVDYFDTFGHRVRRYLDKPRKLRPLETEEFFVAMADDAGGSGANFLVYWEGPSDAHPLLTEAIMGGFKGAGYTSFTSRGIELAARPTIPADTDGVPSAIADP